MSGPHLHIKFWVGIFFLVVLGAPILLTAEQQTGRVEHELEMTVAAFGEKKTEQLQQITNDEYLFLFSSSASKNQTGLQDNRIEGRQSHTPLDRVGHLIKAISNGYLYKFSLEIYGLLLRFHILMHWIGIVSPFLIAAIVDGFVTRKIKYREFGYISPLSYSVSLHFLILACAFPAFYLVVPIPITPYFIPGWALVLGLPLILLISNTQRLFSS